jgi:putative nucleotidyltransferase with HDIG domain
MKFAFKSFSLRVWLIGFALFCGVMGFAIGSHGTVWTTIAAIAAGMLAVKGIARRMIRSIEALTASADQAVRIGCMPDTFPANSLFSEFNRTASMLNLASRSMHHSRADLDRAYLQFVETMAQALDARDPYTAGHSLRVAAYAHSIARTMNLPAAEADTIRIAAQLHDIGKIGIPDAVLQKSGPLSDAEFGLIKLHPQIGRRILEKMGLFQPLLGVVELHHENFDGSGYPYKLTGDAIPLAARIVRVADAFDAMVTDRHYRNGLPVARAVEELATHAGTQFDPEVAAVALSLIEAGTIGEAAPGWLADDKIAAYDRDRVFQ